MDRSLSTKSVTVPIPRVEADKPPTCRELEIKFKTDAAGLKLALSSELLSTNAADAPRRTLRSVYFDTPAGDLRKQRMVLRVRKVRRTHLMGLKSARLLADGPFSRSEMEVRVPSLDPNITQFGEEIAAELSRVIDGRALEQRFEMQIKRRLRCLNLERSLIEVAFDEGFVVVGDRRQPLTEIELELKAGEETALYDFAVRLADALPMRLEIMSKAERGFMLAADDRPLPVRAAALKFPTDATLDDAVETVISSALGQFVANWPALTETHHPESIHQLRVALRRLRTALAFFDRFLPCAEFGIFRAEAKRIASALAPARNWDAFRELVKDGPLTRFAQEGESFDALLTTVEERRLAAYAIAQEVIHDPSTTRFVLNLQAFLARRVWRSALSGAELLRLTEPARLFASETLERLHKRALKRGRRLRQKLPEERHEVRIALKHIHYAAQFFSFFSAVLDPTSERSPNSRMGLAPLTTRRAQYTSYEMSRRPPVRRLRRPQASFSAGAGETRCSQTTTCDKHGSRLGEPARSGADTRIVSC